MTRVAEWAGETLTEFVAVGWVPVLSFDKGKSNSSSVNPYRAAAT